MLTDKERQKKKVEVITDRSILNVTLIRVNNIWFMRIIIAGIRTDVQLTEPNKSKNNVNLRVKLA